MKVLTVFLCICSAAFCLPGIVQATPVEEQEVVTAGIEEAEKEMMEAALMKSSQLMLEMENLVKSQAAVIAQQRSALNRHKDVISRCEATLANSEVHADTADALSHDGDETTSSRHKRTDDFGSHLGPVISQLSLQYTELEAEINAIRNSHSSQGNGVTADIYTRWGNAACPANAELVYSGSIGGSYANHYWGAANPLCLPPNPVYSNGSGTPSGRLPVYHANLYGAEYETPGETVNNLEPTCAVCRVPRATHLLLPATDTCPAGWSREYRGYLMANLHTNVGPSQYVCVDDAFDYVPGTQVDSYGLGLYYTLSICGSLACPPFVANKVVLCAVCSK